MGAAEPHGLPELPRRPRRGDVLDLEIREITSRGEGRAIFECRIGPQKERRRFQIDVPRAVPGDHARVSVRGGRGARMEARLESVLRPSPDRVSAPCPHYGEPGGPGRPDTGCGGCTIQGLSATAQLAEKAALVRRLLGAAGVDPSLVLPPIAAPAPFHYRGKIEATFGRDAEDRLALGFHPAGYRYEVLRLETCLLVSPAAARLLVAVREWAEREALEPWHPTRNEGLLRTLTLRESPRTGERLLELVTSGAPVPEGFADSFRDAVLDAAARLDARVDSLWWTEHVAARGTPTRLVPHHLHGAAWLTESLELPGRPPLRFRVHPRAFFQPNPLGAELLYAEVARAAGLAAGAAGHVLDLYSGTGTIALCLAHLADRVTAIELSPEAVENARENAALNRIENAAFHAGDVAEVLRSLGETAKADVVVLDPPRSGLLPGAREALLALRPPRIVYVSCNPQALARDLAALRADGFTLGPVQPLDLFPQTAHVECVATLTSRRPDSPSERRENDALLALAAPAWSEWDNPEDTDYDRL